MLGNFLANPFLCCCHLILLQPETTADSFRMPYCFWSEKNINPDNILQLVVEKINGDGGSPLQMDAAND